MLPNVYDSSMLRGFSSQKKKKKSVEKIDTKNKGIICVFICACNLTIKGLWLYIQTISMRSK